MDPISPYAPKHLDRPAMRQIWRSLTFLHWRYDPAIIAKTLPKQLTLDTFDGAAWVGLVPFVLAGVEPFGLPALPWISQFPETNVRTYVRGPDGERGVWFHTLEADRLAAVLVARWWYHLPYRWAKMNVIKRGNIVEYQSARSALFGSGKTDLAIEIGEALATADFDHFLTARFRLYAAASGRVAYAQIEHEPWTLQSARIIKLNETLMENSGVPRPEGEPVLHYSDELHIKAEALRWID
jgi:hypothetical protein